MWQESTFPEHPVMAYKWLTSVNQDQFNDEMYEAAARLLTWDLPPLKEIGENDTDIPPTLPP